MVSVKGLLLSVYTQTQLPIRNPVGWRVVDQVSQEMIKRYITLCFLGKCFITSVRPKIIKIKLDTYTLSAVYYTIN